MNDDTQAERGWTKEPWHRPCICDPESSCNCTSILSEQYHGSIAQITVNNGKAVGDGGNDAPPIEEAAANAARIVACVNGCAGIPNPEKLLSLICQFEDVLKWMDDGFDNNFHAECKAALRACGIEVSDGHYFMELR